MTKAQPLPSYINLIKRTLQFIVDYKAGKFNDVTVQFMLQRLEDEALKEVQGPYGFAGDFVKTALCSVSKDREKFVSGYNDFITSYPEADFPFFFNLCSFAKNLGMPELGIDFMRYKLEKASGNINALGGMLYFFVNRLQFFSSMRILIQLESLGLKLDEIQSISDIHGSLIKDLTVFSNIFESRHVRESDALEILAEAANIIYENTGKTIELTEIRPIQSLNSFRVILYIPSTDEEAFNLSWSIAESLTNKFENSMSDIFTIAVIPL